MDIRELKIGFEFAVNGELRVTFHNGNTLELRVIKSAEDTALTRYNELINVEIYNTYTKKQYLFNGQQSKTITVDELPELINIASMEIIKMSYTEQEKQQLRIALAKDVIEQLTTEKYEAVRLSYIDLSCNKVKLDTTLDEVLQQSTNCKVCALGSITISYLKLNKITLNYLKNNFYFDEDIHKYDIGGDYGHIYNELSKIFEEEQLILIESAYEGQSYIRPYSLSNIDADNLYKAITFTNSAKYDVTNFNFNKEVMIDIMQNIIDNDGVFVP